MLLTGFRTFHFVSFLYVFFFSFLFLLFRFFSHYFVFVFLRFVFFSFLFVTFLLIFFSFFCFPFLFVSFRFFPFLSLQVPILCQVLNKYAVCIFTSWRNPPTCFKSARLGVVNEHCSASRFNLRPPLVRWFGHMILTSCQDAGHCGILIGETWR